MTKAEITVELKKARKGLQLGENTRAHFQKLMKETSRSILAAEKRGDTSRAHRLESVLAVLVKNEEAVRANLERMRGFISEIETGLARLSQLTV